MSELPEALRPQPWPPQDPQIASALERVWQEGQWGRYEGAYTARLSERLAEFHQVPYVYLCASGTCAVELALRGVGVRPGDEVALAGYDFPGNFRAVEAVGAYPVLVDVCAQRWTMDVDALRQVLEASTIRAVIVSHLHGELAPMREICHVAAAHHVAIIEDACQATGAWVQGRRAGTWGTAGVLSFGGSKLLTAGRGGAILTHCQDVIQRVKIYAERGNVAYPLSELQAAVLLPQLEQLDQRNQQRCQAARRWCQTLEQAWGWLGPQWSHEDQPAFYKLGFYVRPGSRVDGDSILRRAQAHGLPWGRGFLGFTRRSPRRCRHIGPLSHSQHASERTILVDHTHLAADPQAVLNYLLVD